jgi:4-amino-4-deoxy-L-arabinose transferase-like glycosyltransferase
VNLVQFLFLLFSLSLVILITEWFKLSRSLKTTAVFLVLTIPQILLQASATQNDIVIGFFILSSVYFAIQSLEKCTFLYYVFFGISVGLSIFTKGTAYIFLAPILMIFAIVFCRRLVQKKDLTSVRFALIAALIFLSINA